MTTLLAHRGPDEHGFYFSEPPIVGLGHRRLAIIDLPGGRQPMSNEDGSIWIVFDGEIYNFLELRQELIARGHLFRTSSDTEVIIHQYEEDGPDCLHKFIGMFAFALWDSRKKLLFLARDRVGIKSLYYTEVNGHFLFASEISPLLPALPHLPPLQPASLWAFLALNYVPAPATLFQGIFELEPGRRLLVDAEGVRKEVYWNLPPLEEEPLSGQGAEELLVALFEDAMKRHLIADVPVGAFLSGGIDSTSVVAAMDRLLGEGIKTFSVDFHAALGAGGLNETRWSQLAAGTFATKHHALTVTAEDARSVLPVVVARLDDLISDPAVIPTYILSSFARNEVKVVLCGEGGDELFAGYQRYILGPLARFYQPLPRAFRRFFLELPAAKLPGFRRVRKGLAALGAPTPADRHVAWLLVMPRELIAELIGPESGGEELAAAVFGPLFRGQTQTFDLNRTIRADLAARLPDSILIKLDRSSMAVGLECRVPFLDHRLVELALRIPAEEKVHFFSTKIIFKRVMRGRIPDAIIRRKKVGFTLPLDAWFRRELKEMLCDYLSPDRLARQGIFHPAPVQELIRLHLSGRESLGHTLFSLLIFQLWHDSIKGEPTKTAS